MTDWMDQAACKGKVDVMFPSDGVGVEVAKAICARCPVEEACLEYALKNHLGHGIWGGKSERQRRGLGTIRRCRLCEAEFRSGNGRLYCSDECRRSAKRPARRRGVERDALLQQIADCYEEAVAAGQYPTRAVGERFGFASSGAAAKWVQEARKAGYLAPVKAVG